MNPKPSKKKRGEKARVLLSIDLDRVVFINENGEEIRNVKAVSSFLGGIIVFTKNGMYSNVPKLIKRKVYATTRRK